MSSIIRQRIVLRVLGLAGCCVLAWGFVATAAAEDSESGPDFSQYKILLERNIFDATRDRPRPQPERPRQQPRPTPAPNPDYLDVTGAFVQGDQTIVFFEGSKPDFNQAAWAGSQIAGAQLAEVSINHVMLDFGDGETVVVPVGSRLMIQPDGTTSVVEQQRTDRRAPRATAADRRNAEAARNAPQQQGGRGGGDLRGMIQGFVGGGGLEQLGIAGGMFGAMPGMGEGMPGAFGGGAGGGAGGGPGGRGGQAQRGQPQVQASETTLSAEEQAAILERMRARREEESGR